MSKCSQMLSANDFNRLLKIEEGGPAAEEGGRGFREVGAAQSDFEHEAGVKEGFPQRVGRWCSQELL
jgi:hypothetical protein